MTAKSTVDGEESNVDTMIERIRIAQEEPWRKLRYVDENSSEAWTTFEELFVDIDPARKNTGEGAAKEGENTDTQLGIPKLESSMSNEQYLDAISAPREQTKLKKRKRGRKLKKKDGEGIDGNESSITVSDDEDVVMEMGA